MPKIEPGTYILWGGKLAKIIGTTDQPTAILEYVRDEDKPRCECGRAVDEQIHMVIGCLIWENNVAAVPTIDGPR